MLFSRSSKRWKLIKGKLNLTNPFVRHRIEAVKALLLQLDNVVVCIESLKSRTEESDTLSACESILNEMIS